MLAVKRINETNRNPQNFRFRAKRCKSREILVNKSQNSGELGGGKGMEYGLSLKCSASRNKYFGLGWEISKSTCGLVKSEAPGSVHVAIILVI